MKHKAFRWIPAVLLAALLAGCGAETATFHFDVCIRHFFTDTWLCHIIRY